MSHKKTSVLIIQNTMVNFTGGELYTFEIANKLHQLGYKVCVYCQHIGLLGKQLKDLGVKISNNLSEIAQPDVIHGHELLRTAQALDYFSDTPAIFICHNHLGNMNTPPQSSRIVKVFGVSQICLENLQKSGTKVENLQLLENFVDINRFVQRPALPPVPTRAAVFSNYATWDGYLPAIKAACDAEGISLEVIGSGVGNRQLYPEQVLPQFDIVFAKARAALEAMAIGNAVILCDFAGVGEMVTSQNYDRFKPLNFGFSALTQPHSLDVIRAEIRKYNPLESIKVTERIRQETTLDAYIIQLEEIYRQAISSPIMNDKKRLFTWQFRLMAFLSAKWAALPEAQHSMLKKLFHMPLSLAKRFLEAQLVKRRVHK